MRRKQMSQPIEIFCCAAESDQSFLGQLSTQLALQQQQGIIKLWNKSQIPAGAIADKEIQQHVVSARIFLLLISPDFLADEYCYNIVMKAALERHANQEAITIPVIVRPANWKHVRVLKHIQVLPRNGQPISGQHDQDYALWEVAKEIDMAIQRLGEPLVEPDPEFGYGPYGGVSSPQTGSGPNTGAFHTGQSPSMGYQPMIGAEKIYSSSRNERKKIGIILVLVAVVIILGGGAALALYAKSLTNTLTKITPYPTPISIQVSPTSAVTTPQNTSTPLPPP